MKDVIADLAVKISAEVGGFGKDIATVKAQIQDIYDTLSKAHQQERQKVQAEKDAKQASTKATRQQNADIKDASRLVYNLSNAWGKYGETMKKLNRLRASGAMGIADFNVSAAGAWAKVVEDTTRKRLQGERAVATVQRQADAASNKALRERNNLIAQGNRLAYRTGTAQTRHDMRTDRATALMARGVLSPQGHADAKAASQKQYDRESGITRIRGMQQQYSRATTRQGESVTSQFATPAEAHAGRLADYNRLLTAGAINQATFNRAVKGSAAAYKEASNKLGPLGHQMRITGMRMHEFGRAATWRVTMPLAAGFAAATKEAVSFETSLKKMVTLAGVSKEQSAAWGKEILASGKDPTASADALYFIASSGIKGAKAMETLQAAIKGSEIGMGEVKNIADLLTSAMNAYAKKGYTANQVMSYFTATIREGKLEADALNSVAGRLFPIASGLGVRLENLLGTIANLSRTGSGASEATASMSQMMITIAKPGKEATKILESVGLSFAQLREVMRGSGGPIEAFRLMDQAFKDDEESFDRLIPNVRALRGALSLLSQDARSVDEVMRSVGSATEQDFLTTWAESAKRSGYSLKQLLNQLKITLVELGTSILPMVVSAANWLKEALKSLVDWWKKSSDSTKKWIVGITLALAAIGPLVSYVGLLTAALGALLTPLALAAGKLVLLGVVAAGIAVGTYFLVDWIAKQLGYNNELQRSIDLQKQLDDLNAKKNKAADAKTAGLPLKQQAAILDRQIAVEEQSYSNLLGKSMEAQDRQPGRANARSKTTGTSWNDIGEGILRGLGMENPVDVKLLENAQAALDKSSERLNDLRSRRAKITPGRLELDEVNRAESENALTQTSGILPKTPLERADIKRQEGMKKAYADMIQDMVAQNQAYVAGVGDNTDAVKVFHEALDGLNLALSKDQVEAFRKANATWKEYIKAQKELKESQEEANFAAATAGMDSDQKKIFRWKQAGMTDQQLAPTITAMAKARQADTKDKEVKKHRDEVKDLKEKVLTPEEKRAKKLKEYDSWLSKGEITATEYQRAVKLLDEEIAKIDRDIDIKVRISGIEGVAAGSAQAIEEAMAYASGGYGGSAKFTGGRHSGSQGVVATLPGTLPGTAPGSLHKRYREMAGSVGAIKPETVLSEFGMLSEGTEEQIEAQKVATKQAMDSLSVEKGFSPDAINTFGLKALVKANTGGSLHKLVGRRSKSGKKFDSYASLYSDEYNDLSAKASLAASAKVTSGSGATTSAATPAPEMLDFKNWLALEQAKPGAPTGQNTSEWLADYGDYVAGAQQASTAKPISEQVRKAVDGANLSEENKKDTDEWLKEIFGILVKFQGKTPIALADANVGG